MASSLSKITQKQVLLLHVVNAGADLRTLTTEGLTHSQIAFLLARVVREGLLLEKDGHLFLSRTGKLALKSNYSSNLRSHNLWIWPRQEDAIAESDVNDVYLPTAIVVAKLG